MKRKTVSMLLALSIIFTGIGLPVFSDNLTSDLSTQTVSPTVIPSASPEVKKDKNDAKINLFADATDITSDFTSAEGNIYTIREDGEYVISNVGTLNASANTIVVPAGRKATLILNNVNIESGSSPIKLEAGAELILKIEGQNNLTAKTRGNAGIAVIATNSSSSSLTIEGSGTLNVQGAQSAAGIGGNTYSSSAAPKHGMIIINSGTITAAGGAAGAGIGSGQNGDPGTGIEINGGIITARGGTLAPGIGGFGAKSNAPITINGGYIEAFHGNNITWDIGPGKTGNPNVPVVNGGSINAVFQSSPVDKFGTALSRKIILTMPEGQANAEVTIGESPAFTDDSGKLYIYAEENVKSISVKYNSKTYFANINDTDNEYTLQEDSSGGCICTPDNASVTINMPDTIEVNVTKGQTDVKLETIFNKNNDCEYSSHSVSAVYTITDLEGNSIDSSVAVLGGNYLTAYYNVSPETIHIKSTASINGKQYIAEKDITIVSDETIKPDLSAGNIEIAGNGDGTMTIRQGLSAMTVSQDTTVHIVQSTSTTDHTITIRRLNDVKLSLENVNIRTVLDKAINLSSEDINLTLELVGTNKIASTHSYTINGIRANSTITVEGTGSLESVSGSGPGIGNIKTLTVKSGTVTARGGDGGAGIGGGNDGMGIEVIVEGGKVYAYGNGNAAGIGGGASADEGAGGSFKITGGMVSAQSGGSGCGIGYGGKSNSPGTVIYEGGNISADIGTRPNNGRNQYRVAISAEGISGESDIEYSIGEDNSQKVQTSTDSEGKIYLYLNAGKQWIRLYKGGKTYYRYMNVVADDNNQAECLLNPKTEITSFEIAGQKSSTIGNNTIDVTVPYNIDLSQVTPMVEFDGAEINPILGSSMNFSNESHSAELTVIGHDFSEKKYTININVDAEPSETQMDTYDISKGNITIAGDSIEYGGTRYRTNPLGYVITGNTSEHTLAFEYASEKLPPVIFENLNILSSSAYAVPFTASSSADITVKGSCNIQSVSNSAMNVTGTYGSVELNFTGDGIINIQGGTGKSAVNLGTSTKMTVYGLNTRLISSAGNNALEGGGEFFTDSETYIRIDSTETPEIQPKNAEGTPLYQLTAHIDADNISSTTAVYNEKTYYVGEDATLYIMVPDGMYQMTVVYNTLEYDGKAEINGAGAEVTLTTLELDSLKYFIDGEECMDNKYLSSSGAAVLFKAEGKLVDNAIKITLKKHKADDEDNFEVKDIEQFIKKDGDGNYTASIVIPENPYGTYDIVYDIYYTFRDRETKMPYMIGVQRNSTLCKIENFTVPGQIESRILDEDSVIRVDMPYDHKFQDRYAPTFSFVGGSTSPISGSNELFIIDHLGKFTSKNYTVKSKNGETDKTYTVKIYKQTEPKIKSFSLTNNTVTSDGGTVTVTVNGTSLANIKNAEQENNKKVYIYAEADSSDPLTSSLEPVEAVLQENGTYTAEISVDRNDSDTSDKKYKLKAKIGDTPQTDVNSDIYVITVPRQRKSLTGINSFTLPNQVSSEIDGTNINIVMPFDAELTELIPAIVREDIYADYSPKGPQDFNSDVNYTITAENGVDTEVYTVHVTKQGIPAATGVEFTDPRYSSAGRVAVKINGNNLESIENALTMPKTITVSAVLKSGDPADSTINTVRAVKNDAGDYIATIIVPSNNSTESEKTYTLSVTVGNALQTLSGNTTLTVPKKEANSKELTDIIIAEGQSELMPNGIIGDEYEYVVYVPYNTDLRSITPQVFHTGEEYSPKTAQNFMKPVHFTVTAYDGSQKKYVIKTIRDGIPNLKALSVGEIKSYRDTNVTLDLKGDFIPYITEGEAKDVIKVSAVSRDDGSVIEGTVEYDSEVYSGHAAVHINLPVNTSFESEKIYDIKVMINDSEQSVAETICIPRRRTCEINSFNVEGQIGATQIVTDDENGSTILFTMSYNTDLTNLLPEVRYDGDSYTPLTAQDFDKKAVNYTVYANDGESRTYSARAQRDGKPSISSVNVTNTPTTFNAKTINVDVEGVFFYNMKVKAVSGDEVIDGRITMNEAHSASAEIDLPQNDSMTADKTYTLEFYMDDFEDPIEYSSPVTVTVPRRKTRAITSFKVNNQVGTENITGTDVYVKVEYDTDISNIIPTVTIDGDSYTPEGNQNFNNASKSIIYTVSAEGDTDRTYNVHIARDGEPVITKVTHSIPAHFNDKSVSVNFEGIFFETASVSAVPVDGGTEIRGTISSFSENSASAVINLLPNTDTEHDKKYQLKFIVDGVVTPYDGDVEITLPRRTTREITEFTLPDIQEGETRIEGTNIYIDVPYHLDITSITPEIKYDADTITPQSAQNFNGDPIKYTLSSAGDEDTVYTVYITRIGNDPYIKSVRAEKQAKETEFEGDNIYITLKANANLKEVEPVLDFDGADYSPRGPQNFSNSKKEPIVYTVVNKYGIEHKYYITIDKKSSGKSSNDSATTPTPTVIPTKEPDATPAPTETVKPTNKPYMSGYEDGTYRPDNTITRAEVATILSMLDDNYDENERYESASADVNPDAWYANYVNFASSRGYMSGYEDSTYRPDNTITRAEFASMVSRYIGIDPIDGENRFADIDSVPWCSQQINALSEAGIVSGYEDGLFKPSNYVTRAESASIINRALGKEIPENVLDRIMCPYQDITASHWAYIDTIIASCEF